MGLGWGGDHLWRRIGRAVYDPFPISDPGAHLNLHPRADNRDSIALTAGQAQNPRRGSRIDAAAPGDSLARRPAARAESQLGVTSVLPGDQTFPEMGPGTNSASFA